MFGGAVNEQVRPIDVGLRWDVGRSGARSSRSSSQIRPPAGTAGASSTRRRRNRRASASSSGCAAARRSSAARTTRRSTATACGAAASTSSGRTPPARSSAAAGSPRWRRPTGCMRSTAPRRSRPAPLPPRLPRLDVRVRRRRVPLVPRRRGDARRDGHPGAAPRRRRAAALRADRVVYRLFLNASVASGGSVTSIDHRDPCIGTSVASTPPRLPTSEPP